MGCELLIVRHASAVARRPGRPDAARRLTSTGRRRARAVCAGLAHLELRVQRVLTSPWLRAQETANELAPLCDGETRTCEALARPPGAALLAEFAAARTDGVLRLAVVGHQPWLGELLAWLALGEPDRGAAFHLGKASVVCLRGTPEPGGMTVLGLWPARVLARVTRG